jgi:hypothetical protein
MKENKYKDFKSLMKWANAICLFVKEHFHIKQIILLNLIIQFRLYKICKESKLLDSDQ